jgi:hypothetical protein
MEELQQEMGDNIKPLPRAANISEKGTGARQGREAARLRLEELRACMEDFRTKWKRLRDVRLRYQHSTEDHDLYELRGFFFDGINVSKFLDDFLALLTRLRAEWSSDLESEYAFVKMIERKLTKDESADNEESNNAESDTH